MSNPAQTHFAGHTFIRIDAQCMGQGVGKVSYAEMNAAARTAAGLVTPGKPVAGASTGAIQGLRRIASRYWQKRPLSFAAPQAMSSSSDKLPTGRNAAAAPVTGPNTIIEITADVLYEVRNALMLSFFTLIVSLKGAHTRSRKLRPNVIYTHCYYYPSPCPIYGMSS